MQSSFAESGQIAEQAAPVVSDLAKRWPDKITRASLLALPSRDWNSESIYSSLYLVPTGKKHDSGYSLIAIIGRNGNEGEIAAHCDDICWSMPVNHPYGSLKVGINSMMLRTDCLYPSGIMHMWASAEHYFDAHFRVGASLSSTDVELFTTARSGSEAFYARRMLENAMRNSIREVQP